jgi:nitric oxide reductase NorD protein
MKSEQEKELDYHTQKLANKVKAEFATYAFNKTKEKNLPFGEEINLDAWIAYSTSAQKSQEKQNFFINTVRQERDLSTLILADISLSTEAMVTNELSILDIIKQSLFVFADALDTLGDPLGIYAFSSVKNTKVRYHVLKNFNEAYSGQIRGRIDDLRAGYYTRLGAAIRQSTRILEKQNTQNKLMLIISDGKPNDIDRYEGRYGVEDTKKAIVEARKAGVIPFCITVDSESYEYLPQIFGKDGYTYIRDIKKLPQALPEIYMNLTQ